MAVHEQCSLQPVLLFQVDTHVSLLMWTFTECCSFAQGQACLPLCMLVWGLCGGSHVWGCLHPCMHVWGQETVAERRSCIAALPSQSMVLLQKPVVWTCQYERAVCGHHSGIPFLLSEQCITFLLVEGGSSAMIN